MNMVRYRIRFFFDWGCTPFWSGNDAARERFDYAISPENLPLAPATVRRAYELSHWYDRSLNADYPPDPGPWDREEYDRFRAAVREFLAAVRGELGDEFEVVDEQSEVRQTGGL